MTTPDTKAIRAQMEALSGFARGPWKVSPTDDTTVITHDGNMVAEIDGDYNEPDLWPIMEANARLIAAAPDMHEAITALSERCRVLEEALSGLEWACDQLASTRTHEVYLAMIDSGQADALLSLDARRQAARAVLAQKEGK